MSRSSSVSETAAAEHLADWLELEERLGNRSSCRLESPAGWA